MRARLSFFQPYGLALFGGYALLFWLRHTPVPQKVPGLLAVAPGYAEATAPFGPVAWLSARLGLAPALIGRLALLLVFGLLFVATWRAVQAARHRAPQPGDLARICGVALLCSVPLLVLPYLFSRDIYSYIIYGRMAALYGSNPSLTPPIAFPSDPFLQYLVSWRDTPSVYGPAWALVSHALTLAVEAAGGALWQYIVGYKLLAIGLHLANAGLIWRILAEWKPEQRSWGTVLYAWNPVALLEFAGSAHNDVMMLTLLLAGVLLARRQRWRWALVALVAAALVKWIAVIVLPLYALLLLREAPGWRARASLAAQIGALVLGTVVLLHLPYGDLMRAIPAPVALQSSMKAENSLGAIGITAARRVAGWAGLAARNDPALRRALEAAVGWASKALFGLGALAALAAVWRRPTFERWLQSACWLLVLVLVAAPVFRVWYAAWPLALAALLPWRRAGQLAFAFTVSAPLVYLHWGPGGVTDALVFLPILALLAYWLRRDGWLGRAGSRRAADLGLKPARPGAT